MKHVCVNLATASCTRETTLGAEAPTEVTAMPEPRSTSWLPSTSRITPPSSSSAKTGREEATPAETAFLRRSVSAWDLGPGMLVLSSRF